MRLISTWNRRGFLGTVAAMVASAFALQHGGRKYHRKRFRPERKSVRGTGRDHGDQLRRHDDDAGRLHSSPRTRNRHSNGG